MKKIKLIVLSTIVFITIATSVIFISCNKEQKCSTCKMRTDFLESTIKLESINYKFKLYPNTNGEQPDFGYTNTDTKHFMNSLVEKFNLKELRQLNNPLIASVVIYYDDKIESISTIDETRIKALLVYVIEGESYKTYVYELNGNNIYNFLSNLNLKTNYISSNDAFNLNRKILSSQSKSILSFNNYKILIKTKNELSKFQRILSLPNLTLNNIAKPNVSCGTPCLYPMSNAHCEVYGENDYACWVDGGGDCLAMMILEELINEEVDLSEFNVEDDLNSLYSFKDDYLSTTEKGGEIIDLYYILSGRIPLNIFTPTYGIETYSLISTVVVPLTNQLLANPQSTSILIDDTTKTILLNYLTGLKSRVLDSNTKNAIDEVIAYVVLFSGKSNAFITSYLSN